MLKILERLHKTTVIKFSKFARYNIDNKEFAYVVDNFKIHFDDNQYSFVEILFNNIKNFKKFKNENILIQLVKKYPKELQIEKIFEFDKGPRDALILACMCNLNNVAKEILKYKKFMLTFWKNYKKS